MGSLPQLETTLLPGARALLTLHARELPQRDDLCGAFCASLALRAAGFERHDGEPLDQDALALAAGSVISRNADPGILPDGEHGRRDYRATLPLVEDPHLSGTTAAGLVRAVEELSDSELAAIPYTGPWTPETLGGVFEAAVALERPVAFLANIATHHLWGSRASLEQLLDYLYDGAGAGPPPDWDVGHFVCVTAQVRGPAGVLYALADTYPSLGSQGVHLQPQERLAEALERRDMPAGGMIVVVDAADARAVRSAAARLGLREGTWDNGTVPQEILR
jgi:hypothetical protein